MMGYRDDECRLVKSSVGQFNVSKDTTSSQHACILENRQSLSSPRYNDYDEP